MTSFLKISNDLNPTYILEILETVKSIETDINKILKENVKDNVTAYIFINGNLVGYTFEFEETWQKLTTFKANLIFPTEVSISYSTIDREIHVFTDEGRMLRTSVSSKKFSDSGRD